MKLNTNNMNNEMIVVKEGWWGNVGDIYTFDDTSWVSEQSGEKFSSYIAISQETMNELVEEEVISETYNKECECECDCEYCKLDHVKDFVNSLIDQYEENTVEINTAYENDEIPECVHVEAKTVYYNLIKVLTEIKNILD